MDSLNLAIWIEPRTAETAYSHRDSTPQTDEEDSLTEENSEQSNKKESQKKINVHLNFWDLPENCCLDIGICFDATSQEKICIFLEDPNLRESDIEDLSRFMPNDEVRNSIFNEFTHYETCHDGKYSTTCHKITKNNDSWFYVFSFKDFISIKKAYGGSIIEISLSQIKECLSCTYKKYIRFRLLSDIIKNSYIYEESPCTKLEHYTSDICFLDFRLNNLRTLPSGLVSVKRDNFSEIEKVRCFLMEESINELSLYNKQFDSLRVLEKYIWEPYLPKYKKNKEHRAILAYQWNQDSSNEQPKKDFSLFVKIKKSEVTKIKMLKASGFVVLLGVLSSYLFDLLSR